MLVDNVCVDEQTVLQEPRNSRKLPIIFWCVVKNVSSSGWQ